MGEIENEVLEERETNMELSYAFKSLFLWLKEIQVMPPHS